MKHSADEVIYSTTLDAVSTAKTRLERSFDPALVLDMKATATSDLTVGGRTPRGARSQGRPGR